LRSAETDELIGWTERKKEKDAEPVRHKGALEGIEISRKDAEDMIMAARIAAGWVTAGGPSTRCAPNRRQLRLRAEAAKAAAVHPRTPRSDGREAERDHRWRRTDHSWRRGRAGGHRLAAPVRRLARRVAA
jgi:hypothetical protein